MKNLILAGAVPLFLVVATARPPADDEAARLRPSAEPAAETQPPPPPAEPQPSQHDWAPDEAEASTVNARKTLLDQLDRDFQTLVNRSPHRDKLLKAEAHLDAVNDNSHWTEYARATSIIRQVPDAASIPLLMRYLVLHAERSSRHVYLPEYRKTLEQITRRQFAIHYQAGPNVPEFMTRQVAELNQQWWQKQKATLSLRHDNMTADQLAMIAKSIRQRVKSSGDFSGSGGDRDTAYGSYHNVYYRLLKKVEGDSLNGLPVGGKMIPLFLGIDSDDDEQANTREAVHSVFPYELVWILAEYAKQGHRKQIQSIATSTQHDTATRLICHLALFRSGSRYPTEAIIELLDQERDLERRLIALASLRWSNQAGQDKLAKTLDDQNQEIVAIAACALKSPVTTETLQTLQQKLENSTSNTPSMLYSAMGNLNSAREKRAWQQVLIHSLKRNLDDSHLGYIVNGFVDSWDIPYAQYSPTREEDNLTRARLALQYSKDGIEKQADAVAKAKTLVQSLQTQLNAANTIHEIRQTELRRLLALQSENVIDSQQPQRAQQRLQACVQDVQQIKQQLNTETIKLQSLIEQQVAPHKDAP